MFGVVSSHREKSHQKHYGVNIAPKQTPIFPVRVFVCVRVRSSSSMFMMQMIKTN